MLGCFLCKYENPHHNDKMVSQLSCVWSLMGNPEPAKAIFILKLPRFSMTGMDLKMMTYIDTRLSGSIWQQDWHALLTHWGQELGHHWFSWWLVTCSALSHYLNQYWLVVNRTLRDKLQWNQNWKKTIFIQENPLKTSSASHFAPASMC